MPGPDLSDLQVEKPSLADMAPPDLSDLQGKPKPGEDWTNPLQEEGLDPSERQYVQRNLNSPEEVIKWLETAPGEAGKPKGEDINYGMMYSTAPPITRNIPYRQYEAKQYKPGGNYIAVRPKGSNEKWKVIDPESSEWADVADLVSPGEALSTFIPIPGAGPGASLISKGVRAALTGATYAAGSTAARNLEAASKGAERTVGGVAGEVGISAGAGAVLGPVGEAAGYGVRKLAQGMKVPEAVAKAMNLSEERKALEQAKKNVRIARGAVPLAERKAGGEMAEREEAIKELLSKQVPESAPAAEKTGMASVKEATATPPTPEAIEAALATHHNSSIRFLTTITHPATGVKAKHLDSIPEFKAIVNHWLGEEFISPVGSQAMKTRQEFLARLATEVNQEKADIIASGLAKDLAKWMAGEERKGVMSLAEQEAIERLAKGSARAGDEVVLQKAIRNTIANATPEVAAAKLARKTAIDDMLIADAEVAKGNWASDIKDYMGQIPKALGMERRGLTAMTYRVPLAIGRLGVKGLDKLGNLAGRLAGVTPAKLAIDLRRAPGGIQAILGKILKDPKASEDPAYFLEALAKAANIAGVKAWLESTYSTQPNTP